MTALITITSTVAAIGTQVRLTKQIFAGFFFKFLWWVTKKFLPLQSEIVGVILWSEER